MFYDNEVESAGDTSYMAFEPNQIKSITNKRPTNRDNINETLSKEILDQIYLDEDGFEEFNIGVRDFPYEYSDEDLEELGDNYNYGVMFKGHNIGNISVCYNYDTNVLFIDGIEIKAPNKRLGIGTKVVELLKNEFKDSKKIVLNDTDTSSGFYDKLGFKTSKNQKASFNRYKNINEATLTEVYPNKGESKKDFIARFMSVTKDEYPDIKQRYAVANSYWDRRNKK